MKKLNKKAFTLIELIVTIAVIGILVLLASPRFFGHTQNTELTKGFANARSIEKASELYYMNNNDWPRLTDEPYTSEEIESYSERIFNHTGQEINLDPEGNYYDIDYEKLSDYVQVPDDKKNYILQNPVGKVFYMDNLNEAGIARVDYSNAKEEDDNPGGLRKPIEGEIAIDSADKLAKIGKPGESEYPLDGKYILIANIDLSDIDNWTPIGNTSSRFTGSFDGNGYKITRLTINRSETDNVGLFGYTQGATISNVALENINVTGKNKVGGLVGDARSTTISNSYATGSVTGSEDYVGGLVGYSWNSTTISNSYATGSVTSSGSQVGGLAGYTNRGTISNSYATGSVTGSSDTGGLVGFAGYSANISNSYSTGSVTGSGISTGGLVGYSYEITISSSYTTGSVRSSSVWAGGLVGFAYESTIINSYATGSVTCKDRVGGLVGNATSSTTISNSYATGPVSGKSYVGGLVGYYVENRSKIRNSYWDKDATGQSRSDGGVGKSTDEMKNTDTYSAWDTDVWNIVNGKYPTLK